MNALLVSLILFVPFILVGAVTGIIYLISGYKKGLYRSLFSLGITVVSILLSVLLANIISTAISGPVVNLLPIDSLADNLGVLSSFAVTMIQGAVKVALAFVFFVIFLFIALIVLKLVGNRIKWEKLDMKDPDDKKMKFAGLAVRAVDTLLVTFMLLLPFYGSLAVLMPTVFVSSSVTQTVDTDMIVADAAVYDGTSSMQEIIDAINHHPLVSAYRVGPADWVMRGLSDMGGDLENVNALDAVDTISKITALINQLDFVDEDERFEILGQLCDLLKEDVISEDWCYSLVIAAKSDFEKMVDEAAKNDPDAAEIRTYLDMLDMSREEFDANATAIVDFISYAIDNNFDEFYKSSNYSALSEDFYKELGSLINCSKQAISFKKIFYIKAAEELYYDKISDMVSDSYDSDEDEKKALATAFVDTYFKDGKVKEKDYAREGEAFMLAFFSKSFSESVDAFVRHPLFGAESMKEHIDSSIAAYNPDYIYGFGSNIFYYTGSNNSVNFIGNLTSDDDSSDFFIDNEKINSYLLNGLERFEKISITEALYSQYMSTVFDVIYYIDSENYSSHECFVNISEKALEVFLEKAKADKFQSAAITNASVVYDTLSAINELTKDGKLEYNIIPVSSIHKLVCYGNDTSLWPNRIATLEECGEKISYWDENNNLIEEYENPEAYAAYIESQNLISTLKSIIIIPDCAKILDYMAEKMGTAPYGISATLTDKEKAMLVKACEIAYNDNYIDPAKVDRSYDGAIIISISSSLYDDSDITIRLADGTVVTVEGGLPYGCRQEHTDYGSVIRATPEDEIIANNTSLNECIKAIKAFMGI